MLLGHHENPLVEKLYAYPEREREGGRERGREGGREGEREGGREGGREKERVRKRRERRSRTTVASLLVSPCHFFIKCNLSVFTSLSLEHYTSQDKPTVYTPSWILAMPAFNLAFPPPPRSALMSTGYLFICV